MQKYELLNNKFYALKFAVLGTFDDEGGYDIDSSIKEKLIDVTKVIKSYTEQDLLATAHFAGFEFNFKIVFEKDIESEKKYSSLYLIEKFHNRKLETFVGTFVEVEDFDYFDKLKSIFNLITKDESEGKDIVNKESEIEIVIVKKKQLYKVFVNEVGEVSKSFASEIIEVLKNCNEAGVEILKLFKSKMDKLDLKPNSVLYWVNAKNILDDILKTELIKIDSNSIKQIKEIQDKYVPVLVDAQKNAEKKLDAPKKSDAKAKKKAGGAKAAEPGDPPKYTPWGKPLKAAKATGAVKVDVSKYMNKQELKQKNNIEVKPFVMDKVESQNNTGGGWLDKYDNNETEKVKSEKETEATL